MGSSPLSRGIRVCDMDRIASVRIIPALAGNTHPGRFIPEHPRDHPRSRGEYPECLANINVGAGSSPLSRGIRLLRPLRVLRAGIIPALAGNTMARPGNSSPVPDHPRSRGEYSRGDGAYSIVFGSSPLSRGILHVEDQRVHCQGIIPALAGNTLPRLPRIRWSPDHPRSRGEYIPWIMPPFFPGGSSPLSRGIRTPNVHEQVGERIIPALAGNTAFHLQLDVWSRDHPRSRGEYRGIRAHGRGMAGSSPLSRGIPLRLQWRLRSRGIIPALAGNTRGCHV